MNFDEKDDDRAYVVVANDEEQYSIWLVDLQCRRAGRLPEKQGTRSSAWQKLKKFGQT